MTEEEARKRWCPFVRLAAPVDSQAGGTSGNRWGGFNPVAQDSEYLCIGTDCMAWRGRETGEFKARAEAAFRRSGERLTPGSSDREGYCGIAGAPA